jgi:hypothetical protein
MIRSTGSLGGSPGSIVDAIKTRGGIAASRMPASARKRTIYRQQAACR